MMFQVVVAVGAFILGVAFLFMFDKRLEELVESADYIADNVETISSIIEDIKTDIGRKEK